MLIKQTDATDKERFAIKCQTQISQRENREWAMKKEIGTRVKTEKRGGKRTNRETSGKCDIFNELTSQRKMAHITK